MAFQCIKTINGRKYLYQQSSHRIGKKVISKSKCLGAVDPKTGELLPKRKPKVSRGKRKKLIIPAGSEKRSESL